MTPAARVKAAIDLLDQIIEAARRNGAPADRLITEGFRQRRYAGSKDRRAIRELVYGAIRACGALDYARAVARREVDAATASLEGLPASEFRRSLLELASFSVTRTS